MSRAAIDTNSRQTLTALLSTDGQTIVRVTATSNVLNVSNGSTGSDLGGTKAFTDENDRVSAFAVSSSDSTALVALYANASGNLLIQIA